MENYDVIVIGGGPAGLSAAAAAKENGAEKVLLLERENALGGILNQCIHDGFGLTKYHQQLSGPEYALRAAQAAIDAGVEIKCNCMVTHVEKGHCVTAVSTDGIHIYKTKAVIFSTGCRERTRGAISIPGSRPAGIFTAGTAQNLINMKNIMVGRKVVILGSGDIGLIMARRLTLEGATVLAVVEVMEAPGGLARNISQCLYDFNIPLYLSHTVSQIIGKKRLSAVEISKVGEKKRVIPGTAWTIECDTLILSVGLIPENEVAEETGVDLEGPTNCVMTDDFLQTNIPGIFSCGNSRRVMDLADFVSEQGATAGENAAKYVKNEPLRVWDGRMTNTMIKGLPQPNSVTCSLCPNGCQVRLGLDGETEGNRCPKGKAFAIREQECPERILTTTIRVQGAEVPLAAVRSDRPVKLSELSSLAQALHEKSCGAPISSGQILFTGIGENSVNIIAEANIAARKA